jgi:hypothetical protein
MAPQGFNFSERLFHLFGTFVSPKCWRLPGEIVQTGRMTMDNEPKQPKPEILPPLPNTEPAGTPEIPWDKDVPERQQPTRGDK